MSSSLSSVVSGLVRAQMGTSVSSTVTDDDLDRHVAELILREAKKKAEKYGQQGIRAYISSNLSDGNAPRTNKRFLTSIIKSTDEHNKTLLRAQALAAQEVKQEREEQERRQRRARAEEAAEAERLRRSGKSGKRKRTSDEEGWDRWDGRRAERRKVHRNWESWDGHDDEDSDRDTSRRRRRSHSRSRSRSRDRDSRRHRSSHSHSRRKRDEDDDELSSKRRRRGRSRSRSASPRRKRSRDGSRDRHEDDARRRKRRRGREDPDRHSRSRRSRSRSPRRSTSPLSDAEPARSKHKGTKSPKYALDDLREEEVLSRRDRDTPDTPRKSDSKQETPEVETQEEPEGSASPKDYSTSPQPLSHRSLSIGSKVTNDNKPQAPGPSSRRASTPLSDSRSPSPGPQPLIQLPSKMDRYFEESYDPKLDVAPLAPPKVPATGLIDNAEFEGWDAMLELIRVRREDKAEKKRLERLGLLPKEKSKTKKGVVESSSAAVADRWSGEGVSVMDIAYQKRGTVREWDMGKEGF
ncbi:unnamed protein product [Cyclocybe aegerita]|uniref:Uncharacterized protein n=1 Tax=Cyclocybe aegerita TaxID=1973307 RepID=A0A8S0VX64_CYCAE|nr:unnamed protein product [Cyclocybe aegerita]